MKFTKSAKSYEDQILLLKKRGLIVEDEKNALHVLMNVNYYRLSAYFIPFQIKKDIFIEGTTFDDVFRLYKFDRNLRLLFLDIIELIEISIRTKVAYYLASTYGAFGYTNINIYIHNDLALKWMKRLEETVDKSREVFVKEYFKKHKNEKYLPIWKAIETMSFGDLSILYKLLKSSDKQKIARNNYTIDKAILTSWLHALVYIRNLCAHHSRLWNRLLSITGMKPKKEEKWKHINNQKIFSIIMMCKHLCPDNNFWIKWLNKLKVLIEKYKPEIDSMGFPEKWYEFLS